MYQLVMVGGDDPRPGYSLAGIGGVAIVQTLGPLKHVDPPSRTVKAMTLEGEIRTNRHREHSGASTGRAPDEDTVVAHPQEFSYILAKLAALSAGCRASKIALELNLVRGPLLARRPGRKMADAVVRKLDRAPKRHPILICDGSDHSPSGAGPTTPCCS